MPGWGRTKWTAVWSKKNRQTETTLGRSPENAYMSTVHCFTVVEAVRTTDQALQDSLLEVI